MQQRLTTTWMAPPPRLTLRGALLLPLLVGWGCGGDVEAPAGNGGTQAYDACEDSRSLDVVMIASFEDVLMVSGFTNSDGTAPPEQLSPVPPEMPSTPLEAPKCPGDAAPGSGLHIVATGLQAFGYSFGFNNLNPLQPGEPRAMGQSFFDAEAGGWDGLSMWVRKGGEPSASSIFVSVSDRFTDPTGAALFPADERDLLLNTGAYCDFGALDVTGDGVTDPIASQCDRFGAGVGIANEWRFFKVPFSRMRQRAYGRPSAQPGPDPKILGLEFGLDGESWNFWIDDIAFYREPASGAVAP